MAIKGGFGVTLDLKSGVARRWTMGGDGVKRWLDTGAPFEPNCDRSACDDHSPGCDHEDCGARAENQEMEKG